MSNNHQGHSTTTALTNRSKFITIVVDSKFEVKSKQKIRSKINGENILKCRNTRRGDRPMHQTTLTFRHNDVQNKSTTTGETFSGKKHLLPSKRPNKCPSLHTSQIKFGNDPAVVVRKDGNTAENNKNILALRTFEDKSRWRNAMSGKSMTMSMVYGGNTNTTNVDKKSCQLYSRNLAHDKSHKPNQHRQPLVTNNHIHMNDNSYDLLTGRDLPITRRTNHKSLSGDKLLYNIRNNQNQSILG